MDLVSESALSVAKQTWRHASGDYRCMVVCKATFELRAALSVLASDQDPVLEKDVYAIGPGGDLRVASDLVPLKIRPEVLVTGHAHAPKGQQVTSLLARLIVGEIDKGIQVVGDRFFDREGKLHEPQPFSRMPLTWDRAAGGPETSNPAGRPIGGIAKPDFFGRIYAPNLLPRGLVLASRADRIPPVGFGPIAPQFPPRASSLPQTTHAWVPSRWQEQPLPADIDLAYFNAAPRDQQRSTPFGEDKIFLEHLHPEIPMLATRLPAVAPSATADLGAGPQPIQLRCDTLLIDADRGRASLVWRGHVPLDHPAQRGRIVVRGPLAHGHRHDAPVSQEPSAEAAASAAGRVYSYPSPAEVEAALARYSNLDQPLSGGAAQVTWIPSSSDVSAARPALPFVEARALPAAEEDDGPPTPRKTKEDAEPPKTRRWDIETMSSEISSWVSPTSALPFTAPAPETPDLDAPPMTVAQPLLVLASATPFVKADSSRLLASPAPEPPPATPFVSPGTAGIEYAYPPTPSVSTPLDPPPPSPYVAPIFPLLATPEPARAFVPPPPSLLDTPLPTTPFPPAPPAESLTPLVSSAPSPEIIEREQRAPTSPEPPAIEPPRALSFEAYPPERCGVIAARVGCDATNKIAILRAEDLDDEEWNRVHAHWLGEMREQAAKSRKKLLTAYDEAYVRTIESERGPLTTGDYATLAEAAERDDVKTSLATRNLPPGAWPHIHRVWIQRMVKDIRLAKEVRAAIAHARDEA